MALWPLTAGAQQGAGGWGGGEDSGLPTGKADRSANRPRAGAPSWPPHPKPQEGRSCHLQSTWLEKSCGAQGWSRCDRPRIWWRLDAGLPEGAWLGAVLGSRGALRGRAGRA